MEWDEVGLSPEEELVLFQRFALYVRHRLPPMEQLAELEQSDPVQYACVVRDAVSAGTTFLVDELALPAEIAETVKAHMIHVLDQQGEDWKRFGVPGAG